MLRFLLPSGNLFLSFIGKDKFRITSVMFQATVDEIRDRVLRPDLWPSGVLHQQYNSEANEFSVQFDGQPWIERGEYENMYVIDKLHMG